MLFEALLAEHKHEQSRRQHDADRDLLVFTQSQGHSLGHILSAKLDQGGFCTMPVPGAQTWNPSSYYYESLRIAAKAGRKIHRAFLLPLRSAVQNPSLHEHRRLDAEAGIETSVLYIGKLISMRTAPLAEKLEFGIWDDEVVCMSHPVGEAEGVGGVEWRLSRRPQDLQLAIDLRDLLLSGSEDLAAFDPTTDARIDLEEPMLTTAPMAAELAPILCRGNHVARDDCSWYHSVWQYLRIFDLVSTPTWHAQYYLDTLTQAAKSGRSKILISGTADYSMLAHVLRAYDRSDVPALVTVVDLCETPLLLCRWYARYAGTPIDARCADIIELPLDGEFDLIVTDAFLTRFDFQSRAELLGKWHQLLRPGGCVVTTVRIEQGAVDTISRATQTQTKEFRSRALREATKWKGFLDRTPDEVASMAERYAERMVSNSVGTVEDLKAAFSAAGFEADCQLGNVPGEMVATTYARITATRM